MRESNYRYGLVLTALLCGALAGVAWYALLYGLALLEASDGMRVFLSTYSVFSAVSVGFLAMALFVRHAPALEVRLDRPLLTEQDRERIESLRREWTLLSVALAMVGIAVTSFATQVVAVGDGRLEISRISLDEGLGVKRSVYDISQVHMWSREQGGTRETAVAVPGYIVRNVLRPDAFERAVVAEGAGVSAPAGGRETDTP